MTENKKPLSSHVKVLIERHLLRWCCHLKNNNKFASTMCNIVINNNNEFVVKRLTSKI